VCVCVRAPLCYSQNGEKVAKSFDISKNSPHTGKFAINQHITT